jgi:hypothetical protein
MRLFWKNLLASFHSEQKGDDNIRKVLQTNCLQWILLMVESNRFVLIPRGYVIVIDVVEVLLVFIIIIIIYIRDAQITVTTSPGRLNIVL